MATWHQEQARKRKGYRLFHETLWTVLTDPPGGCTTAMLFETEADARAFLPNAGPHSYVLRPAQEGRKP